MLYPIYETLNKMPLFILVPVTLKVHNNHTVVSFKGLPRLPLLSGDKGGSPFSLFHVSSIKFMSCCFNTIIHHYL